MGAPLPQRKETKPWQDSASRRHHVRREEILGRGSVWGAGRHGGGGGVGLFFDPGCSGNGPCVTSASLPGAVGPALLGKGPSRTHGPKGAGAEGGVPSTTNNSTPKGRPKTETKDGLLLRGACETKTMHAKKVFGKWWGRRGRTRNQKTNSGGKPAPKPPGAPLLQGL